MPRDRCENQRRRGKSIGWALATTLAIQMMVVGTSIAEPKYDEGASDTEIKIGQTSPYSGPVSAWGLIGKSFAAYFRMLNDKGGINNRKINFLSLDDGYSPPKTVEQTRKLVESDGVLAIVGSVGTAPSSAVQKYLNLKKITQLFVISGSAKWNNPKEFPWSTGWPSPSNIEAEALAQHIKSLKDTKIGILYQNDDYGKEYVRSFRDRLGEPADKLIVKQVPYDVGDPTIESQITTLKASGANVFVDITTPRFSVQAIRAVYSLGWNPTHLINFPGTSVSSVLQVAGFDQSKGLISTTYLKDPSDPEWAADPETKAFKSFLQEYLPEGISDPVTVLTVVGIAATFDQVIRQCGDDLTRENVMRQAANLKAFRPPMLLPGIAINTSSSDYTVVKQLQMMRFDGSRWVRFGDVLSP